MEARKALIFRLDTHLDQLADKPREDRVRGVIEPLLAGSSGSKFSSEVLSYIRNLGLVARTAPLRAAYPIYAEVIPRVQTDAVQEGLSVERAPYAD